MNEPVFLASIVFVFLGVLLVIMAARVFVLVLDAFLCDRETQLLLRHELEGK